MAIVSVGVAPNPIVPNSIPGLELGRKGTIAVNENMQSSIATIYAGGDIVRGGATVILAMETDAVPLRLWTSNCADN